MLDINYIRENTDLVIEAARNKQVEVDIDELLKFDDMRKEGQAKMDEVARQRKQTAGQGKPSEEEIVRGRELKKELKRLEADQKKVETRRRELLEAVPNIPSEDTPVGANEDGNEILRKAGELPEFDFDPKEHWELGEALGVIDTRQAAEVSGSRFAYIKGNLAMMQFALLQLAMKTLTDEVKLTEIADRAGLKISTKPFVPVIPPVLIRPEVMRKMGRLEPKEERYHIDNDDLYLVGSAEHSLGPMHMNEVLADDQMPIRYAGYSTSFRREAGSYGQDVKGILRVHQFDKIEIESFTRAENSLDEQNFIVAIQEYLMGELKLPYQVVLKCTGDMGAPNARAVDIETWLPGQGKYRETHSADLMTDYQARRLKTKIKRGGKTEFAHMNDATVFAMGRTLIAIMENYQQADGSIAVPEALREYTAFETVG